MAESERDKKAMREFVNYLLRKESAKLLEENKMELIRRVEESAKVELEKQAGTSSDEAKLS